MDSDLRKNSIAPHPFGQEEAKTKIASALEREGLTYFWLDDVWRNDTVDMMIVALLPSPETIGGTIEASIKFRDEHLYVMAYYKEPFVSAGTYPKILSLLNHANTRLCYSSILDHRLGLDEDTGDIFNAALIRYETLVLYPEETLFYIINHQRQLLEDLCLPIFALERNRWSVEAAKSYLDDEIMRNPKRRRE